MSFDYNPLRHIDIVKVDEGAVVTYCHGCGWTSVAMSIVAPIQGAFQIVREHIEKCHYQSDSDFEGWF